METCLRSAGYDLLISGLVSLVSDKHTHIVTQEKRARGGNELNHTGKVREE